MTRRLGPFRAWLAGGVALAALVAATPSLAVEVDDVRVRYGRHADHVRLVFDWPDAAPYSVELEPKGAVITFDAPNGFDLSRIEGLRRVTAELADAGGVRVRYDRARSLKHFRHGSRVVVDLYETDAGAPLPDAAAMAAGTAVGAEAAETAPAAYPPLPPKRLPPEAPPTAPDPAVAATPDAPPAAAAKDAAPAGGPPDLDTIPPAELRDIAAAVIPPVADPAARLTVDQSEGRILLGLGGPEMHAAAYSRAGGHWLVLDAPLDVDLGAAHAIGLDALQLPFPDKTVIYIDVGATPALAAWRTEAGWRFELSAEPEAARGAPLAVSRRKGDPSGARLVVENVVEARLLRVIDPEVGDSVFVATVRDGKHIAAGHETPDALLPATAVGVVVVPRTEGVSVRIKNDVLDVRKRGGLRLSDPERLLLKSKDMRPTAIDLARWRGSRQRYVDGVVDRMAEMNGVADFGRNAYRLDLARYSIAHGFAAEALGYLQSIARSVKGAAEETEFRMLRGVARAMLGQHDLAAVDLEDNALVGDPNVEIWRALAMAERGEHRFASAKFRRFWSAVAAWPPRFRARLTVAAGEASLAAGLPDVAEHFLQQDDPSLAPTHEELAAFAVIAGKIKAARGDTAGAAADFGVAKMKGDRGTAAKAELALVQMRYEEGAMDGDAAAERLRRLQLNWRGDQTEYETLRTWGQIRLEQSGFREGFWALSEASYLYAERFDTTDVRVAMAAGFKRAFVDGAADELPALEAVALFQDFQDLAPAGAQGDLALANFARRLATLDLVDEADEILDHLVRRRLDGAPRLAAAADLTRLRLSRRQWTAALDVLDEVAEVRASEDMRVLQARLRAEALAGLGRTEEALALLGDEEGAETLTLKARIAWRSADWISARQAYRDLADAGAFAGETLAPEAAAAVVRWAVAASMLTNDQEVTDVAKRYARRIGDDALAAALTALATPKGAAGDALAAARAAIDNAEALAGAVQGYAANQG